MTNSSTGALYEVGDDKELAAAGLSRPRAARVRVPVQFSAAEHERVWRSDCETLAQIGAMFTASPRFVTNEQSGTGHNMSLSLSAAAYHRTVLSFVEECVAAQRNTSENIGGGLMRVGFIGLGSQGGPMARRIVEGGFETTLWARRAPASNRMRTPRRRPPVRLPSWRPPAIWCACAWSATTTCARCSTARPACWPVWRPAASSRFTAPCTPTRARRSPRRLPRRVFR